MIDTSKPYLNIVIPEMDVVGDYNGWGSWGQIKALYNANENKGTGFTTYQTLLQNYRGIKIKVDISDINPRFNKANEVFFYLYDPEDGMMPGTVNNGVKYDITDGHTNKQYINRNGGVQTFTFDFAGTYYMDGSAAPDIRLSMGVESRPSVNEENVHYCHIKPIIQNSNGSILLGAGRSKMQFTDESNTANGGLMDVEKADGSKYESETVTKPTGAVTKEEVATAKDGSKVETKTEVTVGAKKETVTQISYDEKGKAVDADVAVSQVTAAKKLTVDVATVKETAKTTGIDTFLTVTAKTEAGATRFTATVESDNLAKDNKLVVYAMDKDQNLIIVDAKKNVSKITYSTSSKNVRVTKSGKITAKAKGTVTVKAKVTLKNGKSKTIKMKIKVK